MNLLKYFGCIVVVMVSFVFAGCERDDDDPVEITVTNETVYVEHNTTVVAPPASTAANGGDGTDPTEPVVTYPKVTVKNNSSYTVPITFTSTIDNKSESLGSGAKDTFYYSGAYIFTHRTLSESDTITHTASDNADHSIIIYDSDVTNTVESYSQTL